MPAEDDYGQRRQILLHHASGNPTGTITAPGTNPERYHTPAACPAGCPASDRLQASSQERLTERQTTPNNDRLHYQSSSADRFTPNSQERFQGSVEKIEPAERSHHSTIERIHHNDRYHSQSNDRLINERLQTNCPERYQNDRHRYSQPDRFNPVPNINSLDRYGSLGTNLSTAERYQTIHTDDRSSSSNRSLERYATTDRFQGKEQHQTGSSERFTPTETQVYQPRINNPQNNNTDRYNDRYPGRYPFQTNEQYQQERYNCERYNSNVSCPERFTKEFTSQERIPYTQVPYIPPPSPAPASDRFIPPPPLSPTNTPSPDCYPSNPFPSPTTNAPTERFIPPPPLSPSPTEKFSPKPDRFVEKRYPDRYSLSPNPDKYSQNTERYQQYHSPEPRYQDRYQCYPDRYSQQQYHHDRYGSTTERYLPPTAHTPVERYVPQPQEPYYQATYQSYERYPKWNPNNPGDPYMRRDLGYHHHYRLPVPFQANHYQRIRYSHIGTPNRAKCCQYQDYQLSKSSPGSSSSSSVTSQGKEIQTYIQNPVKDIQCFHQNEVVPAFHQEKAIQCVNFQGKDIQCVPYASPGVRPSKVPCKHMCSSPGVEYVGQSGGRHVCATPPPPRTSTSNDTQCGEQCCLRRPQNTVLTTTVWRAPGHHQTPTAAQSPSPTNPVPEIEEQPPPTIQPEPTPTKPIPVVQRAISLPAAPISERYHQQEPSRKIDYSQSERITNRERPKFARSASKKEAIKNFIKKETANFFGVDEDTEVDQQLRWLDRRKRLASRTYGPLKDEFQPTDRSFRRTQVVSFATPAGGIQPESRSYPGDRPDVLPAPSDVPDAAEERWPGVTVRRKDSVARMTWDGISYVVTTLTKHRPRPRSQSRLWSRSYPPEESHAETLEDDVFFERPTTPTSPSVTESGDSPDAAPLEPSRPQSIRYSTTRSGAPAWRMEPHGRRRDQGRPETGGTRIWSAMLDCVLDNSDRRQYGMGWVGKMFGRSMRSSVSRDEKVKKQLDDLEDYRPLFTYWVTTVQVLVLAISLVCYGFGPFGIDLQQRSGQVLVTSLSLQQVEYLEPANFWFGPRAADLIHLGAKFAPCMRVDNKIAKQIDKTREKERETACCIRNDDSGCVQSSKADCSKTISTWKKWSAGDSGPGGRISGSVCGLDPKFCDAPASVHPYEWPDDITKWPICRKTNSITTQRRGTGSSGKTAIAKDKLAEHMVCEVIGHPCCIGIHGQCRITTREYCDFVRGHFHEEASLCSQVSCLDDVCGMVPFYFAETPDQFYRLWTSLFLHAGILQLIVTVMIQHYLMRDLEKLTGPLRIGIIYIGSGVGGNLASSIFVPYRADVGPAGSQFGLLACLIVEVLNSWPMLKHPHHALLKLISLTFVLFMFGLLPWVDNYSHLFGFIFGFLLSYALLPFVSFGTYERQKKVALIWVCLISAGVLFICLVLLFYIIPVYDCEVCSYFNCLPLTRDFCASQNINFMREEPVV